MRTLGLLALLAALGSCRALPEIAANTCGNHAIEAGEDCDGFARFGAECRPPGAVGECHLDCSAGDEGSPQCPEGFGCDLDGVCRRPSGEYDDRRSPIPGSAVELLSGDFDGDGRDDLIARGMPGYLGFSSFSIHYFDQRGALEDSWTTTQLFGASAVTSLSAEEPARSDLLFSVGAFGAMLGEANRTLTPLAYPAYYLEGARVVVLPIWDRGATESSPLLVIRELGTTLELEHPTTGHSAERLVTMGSIDGTLGALAGKPATGPLFEPKQSTCDALGLAFTDQDSVSLYELCQIADGDLNWLEDARVTQLPFEPALTEKGERVVVESGPIFADLDGDGHLDVLVMTNDGPHAALGNGEEFASLEPFRAYPEQNQQADVGENGFDISPIAAGDLTGDGIADLVDPEWLYVSIVEDGAIRYRKLQKSPGEPWEQGLVADLNADGKLDAITVTKRTPGIKFFMGTGSTRVNAFTIPTPYPAEHLTVGDIDGDGISDLAFAMLGRGPSGDDQISVAYGAPAGVPEDPVPVAHASNVSHVSALSDNLEDARADLLVVSDLSVNGGPHASTMSILIGTGDRGLFFSPMVLNTFATDGSLVEDTCVSMTAGHFVDPDKLDVMAVGA